MCCWWKVDSPTGLPGKHSKDPCTGSCAVALWLISVECYLCVPFLSISPWKKSTCFVSKAKQKPVSTVSASYYSLVFQSPHSLPWAPVPARPTWMHAPCGRERANAQSKEESQARERAREHLCSSGILLAWVWDGPGAF